VKTRSRVAGWTAAVAVVVGAVAGGALALGPVADDEAEPAPSAATKTTTTTTAAAAPHPLVAATRSATARFRDYDAAVAAGYRPSRRAGPAPTHHPNRGLMRDGRVLDPDAPESLVYWNAPNGRKVFVGVVYKAGPHEPTPVPDGALGMWHTHTGPDGARCHPGHDPACPDDTTKMMHVFVFDGAVDPFADTMVQAAGGRRAFVRAIRSEAAR
jgi:hypothetical protein